MTYPSTYRQSPDGIYNPEEKKALKVILKSALIQEAVAYVTAHADPSGFNYNPALRYLQGKEANTSVDVIQLNNELIVHYANTTDFEKYYYNLRICTFKVKENSNE